MICQSRSVARPVRSSPRESGRKVVKSGPAAAVSKSTSLRGRSALCLARQNGHTGNPGRLGSGIHVCRNRFSRQSVPGSETKAPGRWCWNLPSYRSGSRSNKLRKIEDSTEPGHPCGRLRSVDAPADPAFAPAVRTPSVHWNVHPPNGFVYPSRISPVGARHSLTPLEFSDRSHQT